MGEGIFPINLPATDGYGGGAYGFRGLFLDGKPAEKAWFAYDTNILSPTRIEFVAYGMLDSVWGGIGGESFRFTVDVDEERTHHDIEQRILQLAADEFHRLRAEEERAAILLIADDIRTAILAQRGGAA